MDGSLLHDYFLHEDLVELYLPQGATLELLQDELLSIKSIEIDRRIFFMEHMFIVNNYQIDNDYIFKNDDEIIILPWLIGG